TPPIAETVGLTAAIEYLEKLGLERVREHEQALAVQTVQVLSAIPGVRVYGPRRERGAVVAFTIEGWHPHDVAAALDAEGIALRWGPCGGGTASRTGARCGPRAVREQSSFIWTWNPVLKVHPFERLRVADCGDVDVVPISIERTFEAIERRIDAVVAAGATPL